MTCVSRTTRLLVSRRTRRGFTLIEVLMAAFVMAIGVLGLTALFAGAARQQQLSSQTTRSVSAARSAEAFIGERFGPIEAVDPGLPTLTPPVRNGQAPESQVLPDQWYPIPRSADGSFSLNPTEDSQGWKDESLFTRARPREALPKLLYRARMEREPNELVPTGLTGVDATGTGLGPPLDFNNPLGAPSFDGAMRELRVLADSVSLRVVTRAFPCSLTSADERSLVVPDDREFLLTWNGNIDSGTGEFELSGPSGVIARLKSDAKMRDAELYTGGTNKSGEITFLKVVDVVDGLGDSNSASCMELNKDYWLAVPDFTGLSRNPCEDEMVTAPEYLYQVPLGEGNCTPSAAVIEPGTPGYVLKYAQDGSGKLVAELKLTDRADCGGSGTLYEDVTGGDYYHGAKRDPWPVGWTELDPVRKIQVPDRFIHEIWLESYEYRGHTLASLPETISHAEASGGGGARVPQMGYSMLFRQTSSSSVQYALVTYAIAPTYSPSADKASKSDDDFYPQEDVAAFNANAAPLRLIKDLRIEFDEDIAQYYVVISGTTLSWVATPGQLMLFNGDASGGVPGADAAVRVVSVRKLPGGEQHAYLDTVPRAGLRALTDFGADNTFDAWMVQPSCEVTQRNATFKSPIYRWGLSPIEARIFTVSQ